MAHSKERIKIVFRIMPIGKSGFEWRLFNKGNRSLAGSTQLYGCKYSAINAALRAKRLFATARIEEGE